MDKINSNEDETQNDANQTEENIHWDLSNEQGPLVMSTDWAGNYIIVERIISGLSWRDRITCAQVCRSWHEIVKNLQRRDLMCYDFLLVKKNPNGPITLDKSHSPIVSKPQICFSFAFNITAVPWPRDEHGQKHRTIFQGIENCLLCNGAHHISATGFPMIYEPLSTSNTYQHTVHRNMSSILGGLLLPQIPGVNVNIIEYRRKSLAKRDVYCKVNNICSSDTIKGVIVFIEERTMLMETEKLEFIKYFKSVQKEEPFALGGCVVGSVYSQTEGQSFTSQSAVTAIVAVFSVPKHRQPPAEFHMHSLLLQSSCFYEATMKEDIKKFSDQVPRTEFSACLKMSCIGRDRLHAKELGVFRDAFPKTTVVGCFGNGEIGYDHPKKTTSDKKMAATYENCSFTYCTVFVLFSWGKMLKPPEVLTAK